MNSEELEQLEHALHTLSSTHRDDLIIDAARKILAIDPSHYEAHFNMIMSLYSRHEYDAMYEAIQAALRYWSNFPSMHYALYLYYLYQGGEAYIKAKKHIEIAIELDPTNAYYFRQLAEIYLINWEPEKAVQILNKAVELDPNKPEYRSRLALALLRTKRLNESFAMAEQALRDAADDPMIHDSVGMIYTLAGNLEKGEELFREALRIWPTYDYFQKHIEWVFREKEDKEYREKNGKLYTPLYLRQKGTKRFFDEDNIK